MLIKHFQAVHTQAAQRFLAVTADDFRPAVLPAGSFAVNNFVPEFCSYGNLPLVRRKRFADEFFVNKRPVNNGGVKQCYAAFNRLADYFNALFAAWRYAAVVVHAHAAKAQCRYINAGSAHGAVLHVGVVV